MYDTETKQKFIELRANGESYDKIAEILRVNRNTLINWNKEFQSEIENQLYIDITSTIELYGTLRKERIKSLLTRIKSISEALNAIDYTQLQPKDLILLLDSTEKQLEKELSNIKFHTGETVSIYDNVLNDKKEIYCKLDF